MSSTNRSSARENHVADYYITPISKIEEFLIELNNVEEIFTDNPLVLDPCAGGDNAHLMSYPTALRNLYGELPIQTIDIREDSLAEIKADYLTFETKIKPKIIITNPPFNKAIEIIQKALNDVEDSGYVIMLLRLNFFGSKGRFPFFEKTHPKYCFVHHERMSFTDKGGTDSIEYCHMVWQKGNTSTFTKLRVI